MFKLFGKGFGKAVADISTKIKAVNQRLKDARLGVSIIQYNNSLYLRSSLFPPKPNTTATKSKRQVLALDAIANPAGLVYAEQQAKLIAGQLATKTFKWDSWLKAKAPSETVADWVALLKKEVLSTCAEITWDKDYWSVFRQMPQNDPLTIWVLRKAINDTTPNSRTRKRTTTACTRLGRLAGLEDCNFSKLGGSYGIKSAKERTLPSDADIEYWGDKMTGRRDRWVLGMMASFGLRPHEIFRLDLDAFRLNPNRLRVLSDTKTGARETWTFKPEWIERFGLLDIPKLESKGRNSSIRGQNVARYFDKYGVPFKPYDLRHAWAVRCIHLEVSDTIAAKMMGHSVAVHQQTYQHWLQGRDFENAVAIALGNKRKIG